MSQPDPVAPRQRETTEWSHYYWYEVNDPVLPRVLLIGDSICDGYHRYVRDELKGRASLAYWASSKCVTDPAYLKELGYFLGEYRYAVIHFNNGLHSLTGTDLGVWETALHAVVGFLRERGHGAGLIWASSTPLLDPALTIRVKELNAIAARVMAAEQIPINDLFALMDPQDRALWCDTYHYHEAGRQLQGRQVADVVRKLLPKAR